MGFVGIKRNIPDNNEVLIKVHAASINDWDSGLLHGDFINRIINGLRKSKRLPGPAPGQVKSINSLFAVCNLQTNLYI
jgi:NADPH:quinone reductase-like Zn-dependent oxidoreductase